MIEDGIERLLAYDGRRYWFLNGWSVRFRLWRTSPTLAWPHGLRYALTLHDVDGARLLGFDNAHGVARRAAAFDHEHRLGRVEEPVPYAFTDADSLLADFFAAVERACQQGSVACVVVGEDSFRGGVPEDDDADIG